MQYWGGNTGGCKWMRGQLCGKLKKAKNDYRAGKDNNTCSDAEQHSCPFFSLIQKVQDKPLYCIYSVTVIDTANLQIRMLTWNQDSVSVWKAIQSFRMFFYLAPLSFSILISCFSVQTSKFYFNPKHSIMPQTSMLVIRTYLSASFQHRYLPHIDLDSLTSFVQWSFLSGVCVRKSQNIDHCFFPMQLNPTWHVTITDTRQLGHSSSTKKRQNKLL